MKTSRLLITGTPILMFVLALLVTGCNDGDGGCGTGGAAPADISGTWTGTMRHGDITVPLTMSMTQNCESVEISWTGEYPDGTLQGTFTGTYVDGTFTASQQGGTIVLNFAGTTACGTLTDSGGTANITLTKSS